MCRRFAGDFGEVTSPEQNISKVLSSFSISGEPRLLVPGVKDLKCLLFAKSQSK